jgi:hypothetical protein
MTFQKMLSILFLMLVLLVLGMAQAHAQTQTNTIGWEYDVPTTEVATYQQQLSIDGIPATGAIQCVATVANALRTACQLVVPALAAGQHTLSIAATRGGVTAETRISGLDLATAPRNPVNPRVTVTVTVNIP